MHPEMDHKASLYLGIFICLGLLASYMPQFVFIIRQKSSLGISPLFLAIGYIGSSSSLANILIQAYTSSLQEQNFALSESSLISITEISIQFICFNVLFSLSNFLTTVFFFSFIIQASDMIS